MRKVLTATVIGLAAIILAGCTGVRPTNLGVKNGKLAPCPDSPNCVSSQSEDAAHRIAPIDYSSSLPDAMARLKRVIAGMKRARIVAENDDYLHVEFTSAVMRFVDDAEFYLDDGKKQIELRSAARLGYSDFGVNRRRMETIRRRFAAERTQSPTPRRP